MLVKNFTQMAKITSREVENVLNKQFLTQKTTTFA